MDATEIILLIAGGIIFIISFFLPAGREENSKENKALVRDEIKELVAKEMDGIKGHVDEVVEETVGYAMEKTERSLERLSNEKIMAVNQYSDTVLQEINKNHQEVMFLYDMLNDKHTNLKHTVSEVNKTVKEVENTFQKLTPDMTDSFIEAEPEAVLDKGAAQENISSTKEEEKNVSQTAVNISFIQEADGQGRNCNDRILELYRNGKSKVSIAKELGLGVGEVKLVIDLYKNM